MIFPADGQKIFDARYFASLGMTITGMPALNAIGAVCEAAPGMVTSADLPCALLPDASGPTGERSPMKLHHVVFCVHHRNQELAANLWRGLGLTFAVIALPDLGIRVLIDWNAGIELVSPVPGSGVTAAAFTTFLENRAKAFTPCHGRRGGGWRSCRR